MPRTACLLLIAGWLAAVGAGFGWLYRHAATPGAAAPAPDAEPPSAGGPVFILRVYAHPHCPCTRATLAELARLLARPGGELTAEVVFVRPADAPADWADAPLARQAAAIPGVTVRWDVGGHEAARAGARTSGHAVLYDPAGRPRFAGGLTRARGHEGDSAGATAVRTVLAGREVEAPQAPVFGCPLETPDREDDPR